MPKLQSYICLESEEPHYAGTVLPSTCNIPLDIMLQTIRLRPYNQYEIDVSKFEYLKSILHEHVPIDLEDPITMPEQESLWKMYFPKQLIPEECDFCSKTKYCGVSQSQLLPEQELIDPPSIWESNIYIGIKNEGVIYPALEHPSECALSSKELTNIIKPSMVSERRDPEYGKIIIQLLMSKVGLACEKCSLKCPINQLID
jgi:hypothetical protein